MISWPVMAWELRTTNSSWWTGCIIDPAAFIALLLRTYSTKAIYIRERCWMVPAIQSMHDLWMMAMAYLTDGVISPYLHVQFIIWI